MLHIIHGLVCIWLKSGCSSLVKALVHLLIVTNLCSQNVICHALNRFTTLPDNLL